MTYKYIENDKIVGYGNFIRSNCISILLTDSEEANLNLKRSLASLRIKRDDECFSIINRGQLWYARLNEEQKSELQSWYLKWLDVTETGIIPEKPNWLK